jgi:hypothetical protein
VPAAGLWQVASAASLWQVAPAAGLWQIVPAAGLWQVAPSAWAIAGCIIMRVGGFWMITADMEAIGWVSTRISSP